MATRLTIGVEIGGARLLAGAVDVEFDVHHRAQRAIAGLNQSGLLDAALDAVEEARNASGAEIAAVGFGIPCVVGQGTEGADAVASPPLEPVRVADLMAERLGLPSFADSAANVATLAEHRAGAAQGAREAVVFTIDAGISAGVIIGGELQRSLRPGDRRALADGRELVSAVREVAAERPASALAAALRAGREPAGALITELAHDGDGAAIDALALLGRRLGAAVAAYVDAYSPQLVVVGGAVLAAGELLLGPARAELAVDGRREAVRETPIVAARFGVDEGIVGAAVLAFDGLQRRGSRVR